MFRRQNHYIVLLEQNFKFKKLPVIAVPLELSVVFTLKNFLFLFDFFQLYWCIVILHLTLLQEVVSVFETVTVEVVPCAFISAKKCSTVSLVSPLTHKEE